MCCVSIIEIEKLCKENTECKAEQAYVRNQKPVPMIPAKVAKIARARKSNEKTDVKIKQTTADAVQQYSLGKIAGAIVDFGRRLFD